MPKTKRRKTRSKKRKRSRRPKKRKKSRRGGLIRELQPHRPHHDGALDQIWNRLRRLIEVVNRCHPNECRDAQAELVVAEPVQQARREIAANMRARGAPAAHIARVAKLAAPGRARAIAAGDAHIPTARAIGAANDGGGGGGGEDGGGGGGGGGVEAVDPADPAAHEIAQQAIRNQQAAWAALPRPAQPGSGDRWILRFMQELYRDGTWTLSEQQLAALGRRRSRTSQSVIGPNQVRLRDIAWRRLRGL